MAEIDVTKSLFLCPICYDFDKCDKDGNPLPLSTPDYELHFTDGAVDMLSKGAKLLLIDKLPSGYSPALQANKGIMHFCKITSPDGKSYIPLFVSYQSLTRIYGDRIRIGVVSFYDAKRLCLEESDISGIVVGPGNLNSIFDRNALVKLK